MMVACQTSDAFSDISNAREQMTMIPCRARRKRLRDPFIRGILFCGAAVFCLTTIDWYQYSHSATLNLQAAPPTQLRRYRILSDNDYSQYIGYHSRTNGAAEENRSYYEYSDDGNVQGKGWLAKKYEQTTMKDVWVCWLFAVAWGTWMFGSFVKSELLRYGQDSITVRGHVRMVTPLEKEGIPIYKVIIDYIIPAHLCSGQYGNPPPGMSTPAMFSSKPVAATNKFFSEDTGEGPSLQIRKEFETLHPLEQGFANVELLVLHHEPTASIIKEDWEQQVMEEMEESRARRRPKPHCYGFLTALCRCMDDLFCGFAKDAYGERIIWKRLWILFCLIMMLLCMSGSVVATYRLPRDTQRLGWLCICLQSMLLIPTAILIRVLITSAQRHIFPEGRAGFVVSNTPSPDPTPANKNLDQHPHPGLSWGEEAAQNDGGFCLDPSEVLDVQVCDKDEVYTLQQTQQQHRQQAAHDPEYVVRVKDMQRDGSDLSDVSSHSQSAPLNPIPTDPSHESSTRAPQAASESKTVESGVMA